MSEQLREFVEFVRTRRAARHFRPGDVPEEIMAQLLEAARWAPSGFNLQPTHFVVVTEQSLKDRLVRACMNQTQVAEAGAVVVFTGDKQVVANNLERFLQQDRAARAISAEYEAMLRRNIPLSFGTGPLGLGWLGKLFANLVAGRFVPIPRLQAVFRIYWLAKQASVAAMNLMLAAHAAGLATCPMEGFSERAVREVLGLPQSHAVILIVPVGYADNSNAVKTRLPLADMVHYNGW